MTLTVKYLKHLQLEGKAENTIDTYKYHLIEFLVWISEQNLTIFNVKPAHLPEFKEHLLKNGKSERTVNCIISCVRGYYDYLISNGLIDTNPVSNLLRIRVPAYRQYRLTDEEQSMYWTNVTFYYILSLMRWYTRKTINSPITKSNRVLFGTFCNM